MKAGVSLLFMDEDSIAPKEKQDYKCDKASPSSIRLKRPFPRQFRSTDTLLLHTIVETKIYTANNHPVNERSYGYKIL